MNTRAPFTKVRLDNLAAVYNRRRDAFLPRTENERALQYAAFGVLTLAVGALTGILLLAQATIAKPYLGIVPDGPAGFFRPLVGNVNPLLAVGLVALVGFVSLGWLYSRGWFEIFALRGHWRGLVIAAAFAVLFGIEIVIVEATNAIRMPADMNVPPPWSLLFYPIIAYVVEIVFHALPLVLLLAGLSALFRKSNANRLVWLCILLVASLEPLFQMNIGSAEGPVSWMQLYIGLHVFAINLAQLYVFRRYDFITMYWFRLVYYTGWHILWGYLRLGWLF